MPTHSFIASTRIQHGLTTRSFYGLRSFSVYAAIKQHEELHEELSASSQIKPSRTGWKPTIGLELHVQLKSPVKLFSNAKTSFEDIPNSHVAFFDAALPGALPVLNPEPVRLALLAALALNCKIHRKSKFDRKHYFYPDLPAGFQITQKYSALATNGSVQLTPRHDGLEHSTVVRVTQVQLEQDTAKSTYDSHSSQTLIDLNRAGTALIEIISEPDLHSSNQAAAYVKKVQSLLRVVGASDANMEKGSMRIDVNVSVAREGEGTLGKRCEVKNLNSIRSMVDAIEYEVDRQIAILTSPDSSGEVEQQTRGFDALTTTTFALRSKADTPDYRYMPDPELAPLVIPADILQELREDMPELPDAKRDRLEKTYGLAPREVDILVKLGETDDIEASEETSLSAAEYFEQVAKGRDARTVANWILHEMLGQLTKSGKSFEQNPVKPDELGELVDAVQGGKINSTVAKSLLAKSITSPRIPLSSAVGRAVRVAASSTIDYQALVAEIIEALPAEAEKVRKGKRNVLARLVGDGMMRTKGRANASHLTAALEKALIP